MIYQIKENKSTRHPSQHIIAHAHYLTTPDLYDQRSVHRSFAGVHARAFRVTRGLASRYSEMTATKQSVFWSWLYSRCHKKLGTWLWCDDLVAHLIYLDILGELQAGRLIYRRSVLTAKVAFMYCDTGQGRLTLVDRSNWWRCPAEEFTKGKPMLEALAERVTNLCSWVVKNDLGCLRVTAAGQSLAAYRHRLGPRRKFERRISRGKRQGQLVTETRLWPRRHDNADAKHLERAAYFGGPIHCYYIGKVNEPVYVLDVRSLYPYIMHQYSFPCELIEVQNDPSIKEVEERAQVESIIASAQISANTNLYPSRRTENTYYLSGSGRYNICGPELLRGIGGGEVRRIYQATWYRSRNLFSPFVTYFYNARCAAERADKAIDAELAKLIMNALPAKFGQQTGEWVDDPLELQEKPWGYWYSEQANGKGVNLCRGIVNGVQAKSKPSPAAHSFVAIPAYVCSYGRIIMDQLMDIARSNGKVYYSAIDSIHCSSGAWCALALAGKIGPELGQLRHKGTYREAEYRGIGDYSLDGQITRSGLPLGAEYVGGDLWKYRYHESAAELIGHGPAATLIERELTVKLPHQYHYGKVGDDGWITPFQESEIL